MRFIRWPRRVATMVAFNRLLWCTRLVLHYTSLLVMLPLAPARELDVEHPEVQGDTTART